jgi:hypothetical protein
MQHQNVLNKGWFVTNEDGGGECQRTYVVLGRTRGGTTMVAKALRAFKLHMGENLDPANCEDIEVTKFLRQKSIGDLKAKFREWDSCHDVWGIKAPLIFNFIDQLDDAFRNPHFIFVMRDPAAIASRLLTARVISPEELETQVRSALQMYVRILEYLGRMKRPTLFMSYEKAVLDPYGASAAMAEFVRVRDDAAILEAQASIRPNDPEYLAAVARGAEKRLREQAVSASDERQQRGSHPR